MRGPLASRFINQYCPQPYAVHIFCKHFSKQNDSVSIFETIRLVMFISSMVWICLVST